MKYTVDLEKEVRYVSYADERAVLVVEIKGGELMDEPTLRMAIEDEIQLLDDDGRLCELEWDEAGSEIADSETMNIPSVQDFGPAEMCAEVDFPRENPEDD